MRPEHINVTQPSQMPITQPAQSLKDPVCGMQVSAESAAVEYDYCGQTYYFCSRKCEEKFRVAPEKYVATEPQLPATKSAAEYTCPMHPEVRQATPGSCPKCGMTLEPSVPVPKETIEYTCPMHPEIVRSQPGSCPICGMALKPRTVTAGAGENAELRDMRRRFWIGRALTIEGPCLV